MSWEKEDKKVWKKSVVMSEFERQILAIMNRLNNLNKEAASPDDQAATQNMSAAEKGAYYGAKEKAMSGASKDQLSAESEADQLDAEHEDELSGDEEKTASLIYELESLLKKAESNKDMLAIYKIERAIQEIKDS